MLGTAIILCPSEILTSTRSDDRPFRQMSKPSYTQGFLTPAEQRYVSIEGEALAVAWGSEQSPGCDDLVVVTDHMPLVKILGDRTLDKITNSRLFRLMQQNSTVTGCDSPAALDTRSSPFLRTSAITADAITSSFVTVCRVGWTSTKRAWVDHTQELLA